MKRKFYSVIAVILALCMLLPVSALAAGTGVYNTQPSVKYTDIDLSQAQGKDVSAEISSIAAASTYSFTLKRTEKTPVRQTLLSVSDASGENSAQLYLLGSRVGFELKGNGAVIFSTEDLATGLFTDTYWYTVTVTFDGSNVSVYVDGVKAFTRICSYSFASVKNPEKAMLGANAADGNEALKGVIDTFEIFADVLSSGEILTAAAATDKNIYEYGPLAYRDEKDTVIFKGTSFDASEENTAAMDSAVSFRIPSLIRSETADPTDDDVLVATIDKANVGMDWGDIDVAVRRSLDGGKTWEAPIKTVLDLPSNDFSLDSGAFKSAFAIDPILAKAANGDLLLIVDFYPECKGLHASTYLEAGAGYVNVNGNTYLALYNGGSKIESIVNNRGSAYTVRENGWVYDPNGNRMNYYVPQHHSAEVAYETMGDMYYCVGEPDYIDVAPPVNPSAPTGDQDIYVGNIYLETGKRDVNSTPTFVQKQYYSIEKGDAYNTYITDAAPLRAGIISQLWVMRSSDNGATWSQPKDITPQVLAGSGDSAFLGTGPGVALTLSHQTDSSKNGRIIAPVYTTGSNNAGAIYSDDNGVTWKRCNGYKTNNIDETQYIELMNGTVVCFGRQTGKAATPVSYSYDGGETWSSQTTTTMQSVKCQKSFITYPFDSDGADDATSDVRFDYPAGMTKGKQYVISSHPSGNGGSDASRTNGVVELGEVQSDNSIKWIASRAILIPGQYDHMPDGNNFFAYSCLTVLENGNIGIHYESQPGAYLSYAEFNLEWLLGITGEGNIPHEIKAPVLENVSMKISAADSDSGKLRAGDKLSFTYDFSESVFVIGQPQIKLLINGQERIASCDGSAAGKSLTFTYTVSESDNISEADTVSVLPGFAQELPAEGVKNGALRLGTETRDFLIGFNTHIEISPLTYIAGNTVHENGNTIQSGTVLTFESATMHLKSKPVCVTAGANVSLTEIAAEKGTAYALSGIANEGNLAFEVSYTDGEKDYKTTVYTFVRPVQRNAHGQVAANAKYGGLWGIGGTQVDNQTVHTLLNSEGTGGSGYFIWDGNNAWATSSVDTSGSTAAGLNAVNNPVPKATVVVDSSVVSNLSEVLKIESALGRTTSVENYCQQIIIFAYGQRSGNSTSYTYVNPKTGHSNTYTSYDGAINLGTAYGGKAVRSISGPVEDAKFTLQMNTNITKNETAGATYVMIDVEVKVVDKAALRAAVEKAKELNPQEFDYTADSLYAFNSAYAAASALLNDDRASDQTAIDSAAQALEAAIAGLKRPKANYAGLDDAIGAANEIDISKYENTEAFVAALDAAVNLDRNLDSSNQHIIDDIEQQLRQAQAQLVPKSEKPDIVAAEGSNTVVDKERKLIYGLEESLVSLDGYAEATNGGSLRYGNVLGTGTTVELLDKDGVTVLDTYTIVIFGDLDGDGFISIGDSALAESVANFMAFLPESCYDLAMDVNVNGFGDIGDASSIESAANYIAPIDQAALAQLVSGM